MHYDITTVAYVYVDTAHRWTVVANRFDGSEDFLRDWESYKHGFGDASGEYWLGNEYLHYLTNTRSYKLRFDLQDWDGETRHAEYSSFAVTSEADKYRLALGYYSGNASSNQKQDNTGGFRYHNNMQFTTYDNDNDKLLHDNCITSQANGQGYFGGFWYKSCTKVTPTNHYCPSSSCGIFRKHIRWMAWHGNDYSLKTVKMMMRPTNTTDIN